MIAFLVGMFLGAPLGALGLALCLMARPARPARLVMWVSEN